MNLLQIAERTDDGETKIILICLMLTYHFDGFVLVVLQHGDYEQVLVAVQPPAWTLIGCVKFQHLDHVAGAVVQHCVAVVTGNNNKTFKIATT